MSGKRSAPDALSAAEKAAVLDELLAARPDLRELAEACAAQVMKDADRSAVANDVEDALQGLGIEEPNTRVGYRPGQGYVHPAVVNAVCCVYLCAAGAAVTASATGISASRTASAASARSALSGFCR